MLSTSNRRLSSDVVEADLSALLALGQLPDYTPLNAAYSIDVLRSLAAALEQAEQEEQRIRNALVNARASTIAAGHELHNAMLAAKAQVIAQYGNDSTVVKTLGLKRKSERKRPIRRTTALAAS